MKPATPVPPRLRLKTYSHLSAARRIPSEYEVASTGLLYHPRRGFALPLPFARWYETHVTGSALALDDWDRFDDPRQTTYARYTALMSRREAFAAELSARMERDGYDDNLPRPALQLFEEAVAPLRFPLHGLQMVAAYVGQLAPSGKIAIACALQAADEVRRIQRIAYRIGQLRRVAGTVGDGCRARWQDGQAWQPLRRLIEKLLCTWDFGEALIALQLCVKPRLDAWLHQGLARRGRGLGDPLFGELLASLDDDASWQRDWTEALLGLCCRERADNRAAIDRWLAAWTPPAREAVDALARAAGAAAEGEAANAAADSWLEDALDRLDAGAGVLGVADARGRR